MASAFDSLFDRSPSPGEGANFFLKLKKFAEDPAATAMMPAPAVESSGAPFQDQVLQLMMQMVQNEFKTMLAYKVYAQSVRGPGREGLAEEFEEHAENEVEHADFLMRRLSVLQGGPIQVPDIPPPPALDDPEEILHTMISMEQEGIENWKNLLGLLGDNPTKYVVEQYLQRELEHLDELFQFLPPQGTEEAGGQPREAAAEEELPAKDQTQQGQPGTPQQGGGPMAGAPPAVKLSFFKTAARTRFTRDLEGKLQQVPARYEGNLEDVGAWANALDEAFKLAMVKTGAILPDKISGGGSRDGTKGSSENKTPDPCEDLDAFATGGKQGAVKLGFALAKLANDAATSGGGSDGVSGPPQQGSKNSAGDLNQYEPERDSKGASDDKVAAAPHIEKAKERAEGNLVAKARTLKGSRGEVYGDLVGRVLGAAGGWKAGKTLKGGPGDSIAKVIGIGMGQAAGGRLGKTLGKEVDASRTRSKLGSLRMSKLALEDEMNMSALDQQAEQAEQANAAAFYAQKAQEHAAARRELEQQLQQATQKASEQEANMQALQQTMAANAEAASTSTTQALLQTVQANTKAIQERQLAADAANANQTLRDQLRQLADGGPSSGDTQGQGDPQGAIQGPSGGPTQGNGTKELQDGPGNAPPSGESNAYQPIESNQDSGSGMPTGQASLAGDGRTPSTPSAYKNASAKLALAIDKGTKTMLKRMGAGAAGGAALFGGATALQAAKGPGELQAKEEELKKNPKSFGNSMQLAQVQGRRASAEAISEHPVGSSLAAMVPGAVLGASLGPAAYDKGKAVIKNIKKLRGK